MTDNPYHVQSNFRCPHDVALDQHCYECDTPQEVPTTKLSDARLDELMASQGRPSLATLYKQGKSSGLIKPQLDYAHAAA